MEYFDSLANVAANSDSTQYVHLSIKYNITRKDITYKLIGLIT